MNRLRALVLGVSLVAAVSGCTQPGMPLSDVVVLRASADPNSSTDIYAERRAAGEQVPAQRGTQIMEVRTYSPRINDFGNEVAGEELAGAVCDVALEEFGATVRTPGAVHVPLYGYRTAPMTLTCRLAGCEDCTVIAEPYNKTIADRRESASTAAAAGGLVGALVGVMIVEAINAASDETNDEFLYEVPPIIMRPAPSGQADIVESTSAPTE